MKDYIKLNNGTQIPIEGGASLDHIVHVAESEDAALGVCAELTPENLAQVEFYEPEEEMPYGVFSDLEKAIEPFRYTNDDDTVTVVISLRESGRLFAEV